MRYSIEPRDRMYVQSYGFSSNMCKDFGKNIGKYLSCKYSQKFLDSTKGYVADALKTASKSAI